jgi:hypothetical protein
MPDEVDPETADEIEWAGGIGMARYQAEMIVAFWRGLSPLPRHLRTDITSMYAASVLCPDDEGDEPDEYVMVE